MILDVRSLVGFVEPPYSEEQCFADCSQRGAPAIYEPRLDSAVVADLPFLTEPVVPDGGIAERWELELSEECLDIVLPEPVADALEPAGIDCDIRIAEDQNISVSDPGSCVPARCGAEVLFVLDKLAGILQGNPD